MLIGYHKDHDLPAKGTRIRIKKGTSLRSGHPQRKGSFFAGCTYTVKIDHVLPGQTRTLGMLRKDEEEERFTLTHIHWRDLYHICQGFGIDYQYGSDVDANWLLGELKKTGRIDIVQSQNSLERVATGPKPM